jgi:hypothetical protein
MFGKLDEFHDLLHLFESMFERFDYMAHFVRGFCHGRKVLLLARLISGWPFRAGSMNGPLRGGLLDGWSFGKVFLGRRCGWFVRGGCGGGGMD